MALTSKQSVKNNSLRLKSYEEIELAATSSSITARNYQRPARHNGCNIHVYYMQDLAHNVRYSEISSDRRHLSTEGKILCRYNDFLHLHFTRD